MNFDVLFENIGRETTPTQERVHDARRRLRLDEVTLSLNAEIFLSNVNDDDIVLLWRPLEGVENYSPEQINLQVGRIDPDDRCNRNNYDGGNRFLSFGGAITPGFLWRKQTSTFFSIRDEYKAMKIYDSMGQLKMRKIRFEDLAQAEPTPSTTREMGRSGSEASERIRQGISMAKEDLQGNEYDFDEFNCAACIVAVMSHAAEYYLERFNQDHHLRIRAEDYIRVSKYLEQLRKRRTELFVPYSASWNAMSALGKYIVCFLLSRGLRDCIGEVAFLIRRLVEWMLAEALRDCIVALDAIRFIPICVPLDLLRDDAFTRDDNGMMLHEFFDECRMVYGDVY